VTSVSQLQFDHYEMTFPPGTLTKEFRDEVDAFWCGVFGWSSREHVVNGRSGHMLRPRDDAQFLFLVEVDPGEPALMLPVQEVSDEPGEYVFVPHLGVLYDSNDDIDRLLADTLRYREKDPRVRVKEYPLYTWGERLHHSFLLQYLLPTWFDVHWSSAPMP
jgi:hypothetical protein